MGSFCQDNQSQRVNNSWMDPLGPTSVGPGGRPNFGATGAPQMRSTLFNYLGGYIPGMAQAGQNYASALGKAASDAGWNQAAGVARGNLAGQYLNGSPQVDRAIAANRNAQMADAANEGARIRSQYNQNGMGFSTGAQQADQANRTAAATQAAQNAANTYMQNYMAERANQNAAGQQLVQATAAPLNYLSQVPGAYTSGLTSAGNLLTGLSSGGQMFNTGASGSYNPSMGSSILNGFSGVVGSL